MDNDVVVVVIGALITLVGGLMSALWAFAIWRMHQIINSMAKLWDRVEVFSREYVSHPFCDERHGKVKTK
jgi:hypothetical protein